VDGAAVVVRRGREVVEVEDRHLAPRDCDVARGGEAADPVMQCRRRGGVVDVDVAVRGERRVECDAEQAALAAGVDRDGQERLREQRAVLDHPETTALLGDEQSPVGSERHRRRRGEAGRDRSLGEPVGSLAAPAVETTTPNARAGLISGAA
jgi:hypothetical protein